MESNCLNSIILASILLAGTTIGAVAELLNIKTGSWEMTIRGEIHGTPPIPEERLKNMSPQQQAAIKKIMEENSKPQVKTMKQCITQEDLSNSENLFDSDRPGMKCTNKLSKHTSNKISGLIDCTKEGTRATGDFSYEAKDREHVIGKVSMTITNGENTMTTKGTMSGIWLSKECKSTK